MRMDNRLIVLMASLAMLTVSSLAVSTYAEPHRWTLWNYFFKPRYCPPFHRTVDGDLVDRCGWRLRKHYGWDNSCFARRHMRSVDACTSNAQ